MINALGKFQANDADSVITSSGVAGTVPTVVATTKESAACTMQKSKLLQIFDLPETPDIIALEPNQRLVAIGDIHGNLDLLINTLIASELIASNISPATYRFEDVHWTGGNAICVFMGDILDRGYREEQCLTLICRLAREASQSGGSIVVLWGNHEVANVENDFTCTCDKKAFRTSFEPVVTVVHFKTAEDDPFAVRERVFARGGLMAQAYLSKLKLVAKVGRSVFVHGGLLSEHLQAYGGDIESIRALNRDAKTWVLSSDSDIEIERRPLWMRDYSAPRESLTLSLQSELTSVLRALDTDRMVVGHTVQAILGGVNSIANQMLWRIDIGDGCKQYRFGASPSFYEEADHQYLWKLALLITKRKDGKEDVRIVKRTKPWMEKFH